MSWQESQENLACLKVDTPTRRDGALSPVPVPRGSGLCCLKCGLRTAAATSAGIPLAVKTPQSQPGTQNQSQCLPRATSAFSADCFWMPWDGCRGGGEGPEPRPGTRWAQELRGRQSPKRPGLLWKGEPGKPTPWKEKCQEDTLILASGEVMEDGTSFLKFCRQNRAPRSFRARIHVTPCGLNNSEQRIQTEEVIGGGCLGETGRMEQRPVNPGLGHLPHTRRVPLHFHSLIHSLNNGKHQPRYQEPTEPLTTWLDLLTTHRVQEICLRCFSKWNWN